MDELDLRDVERELCRLPEVTAARIVEDQIGRPTEIHILANRDKHVKQIARDVQSVALATFGLEIDRRIISVVQLEGGTGEEHVVGDRAAGHRILVAAIGEDRNGVRLAVRVTLRRGDDEVVGEAEGTVATSSRHRLVALATLVALRRLVPAADCVDVETATVLQVGSRNVAVTTVTFALPPREEVMAGSALVRENGEQDALARAVLDAVNRRLPRLH